MSDSVAERGRSSPNEKAAAIRTPESESLKSAIRGSTAADRSVPNPPLISPIAQAAFLRAMKFGLFRAAIKGSTAICPREANAIAACSPGDACFKVWSAGLQSPLSQHLNGRTGVSSFSKLINAGIALTAPNLPSEQAATARSAGVEEVRALRLSAAVGY